MSEEKHTPLPLPWGVTKTNVGYAICGPTGYVCTLSVRQGDIAETIVRACNAFPAMVELLEAAKLAQRSLASREGEKWYSALSGDEESILYDLNKAIAKVEKELEE